MFQLARHAGFVIVFLWWAFWLTIHNSQFSGVIIADGYYQLHFVVMLLGMLVGYFASLHVRPVILPPFYILSAGGGVGGSRVCVRPFMLFLVLFFCAVAILVSGKISGMFDLGFREYFDRVRGGGGEAVGTYITGYSFLDYGLKLFVYPSLMALFLVCLLFTRGKLQKWSLLMTTLLIFLFSYLYQVNYPFIFIFFAMLFSVHVRKLMGDPCRGCLLKLMLALLLVFGVIFSAAVNRYGVADVGGVVTYYFVNYHTLGFYLYQVGIERVSGEMFTLGRSIAGPVELYLSKIVEYCCGLGFESAYAANLSANSETVVAMKDGRYSNAFVTVLFSFYRDFGLLGISFGAIFYGALLGALQGRQGVLGAIYLYVLVLGMLSIYASPFEQPYLWLTPIVIWLILRKIRVPVASRD